jgi:hypothetical protein
VESLLNASKMINLHVKSEETKYAFLSCHQNPGQNLDIQKANTVKPG